jgi:predicted acyltransferase
MKFVPVPGYGAGLLDKQGNFAQYIDQLLLSGHMWASSKTWDPEGIVSTLPAIATTLFGILTGHLLRLRASAEEKTAWMFLTGNALIVAGLILNTWLPINKSLWTTSFAVFMAGMASSVFAFCYWVIDVKGCRRWAQPFVVYGVNAIAVYVLAGLAARISLNIYIRWEDSYPLKDFLFQRVFAPLASPVNASLLYALTFVLLFLGISYLMYRLKWFVKV